MLILERDRAAVERLLLAARERDERVAAVVRAAGARLDGRDDLLVLCAVDDELARLLPDAEHPLYRPISFRPRVGRPRPSVAPPLPPGAVSVRIDVDRLLENFLDPLDELRWPGGGRPGIERIARGIPTWDRHAALALETCLAAVRVGPEGRVAMQRRANRLAALPREVALVEALVTAVTRFAEAHGAPARALEPPVAPRLDHAALEAIARTPDAVEESRRRWLAAEAERVHTEPHRLRVRGREASAIVGVTAPWTSRGPVSLAEALEAWRLRFGSPHDLDRLEIDLGRARLALATRLTEVVDETRVALSTARGLRAEQARGRLTAALALAGESAPRPGADRRALAHRVTTGVLSPDAVEAAIQRLSGRVA